MLSSLDELPVCILSNIASFVDQHVFSEFVCLSRGNRDACLLPTNITFTTLATLSTFREWHVRHRNMASVVPKINLELVVFSDDDLLSCIGMNIEKLVLHVKLYSFSGHGLRHLVSIPLTHLSIYKAFGLLDSSLIHISHLPITSLVLFKTYGITNDGIKHLASLGLTYLSLSDCARLTDDGIAHIANLPLTRLDLSGCIELTNIALSHLTLCPLMKLDLSRSLLISSEAVVRTLHMTEIYRRYYGRLFEKIDL